MTGRFDVAVVGGGIVGLATAHRLLERRPGLRVVVLEKERHVGVHQSSHNSGVIHSGLYYRPGSLKAELCTRGGRQLEAFAARHGIPWERCGKLVVALTEDELPGLARLEENGRANGLDLEVCGPERIREIEPHAAGLRAIHVPGTGVIDFRAVSRTLAELIATAGGEVRTGAAVTGIGQHGGTRLVQVGEEAVEASAVVGCAGLHSDRVAALTGSRPDARIVPFRGDFYALRSPSRDLVNALLYPVPEPAFPFLGVHFTRRLDGSVWAGPNAVLAFAREGYRRSDVSLRDLGETLAFPGFRTLARRHWRTGLGELWRDWSKRAFHAACRRYLPDLRMEDMVFGPSGVRAQLVEADGTPADDFRVVRRPGLLHVLNAPSPAATACLAIGDRLAGWALEDAAAG